MAWTSEPRRGGVTELLTLIIVDNHQSEIRIETLCQPDEAMDGGKWLRRAPSSRRSVGQPLSLLSAGASSFRPRKFSVKASWTGGFFPAHGCWRLGWPSRCGSAGERFGPPCEN